MSIKDDTSEVKVTTSVTLTGAPSDVGAIKNALIENGVENVDSYTEMIESVVSAVDKSINNVKAIDITISDEDIILATVIDVEQLAELNSHRDFEVRYKPEGATSSRIMVTQSRKVVSLENAIPAYEPMKPANTEAVISDKPRPSKKEEGFKKFLKPTLIATGVTLLGVIAYTAYKHYNSN